MLKRDLEFLLQEIAEPSLPRLDLEQYITPADIAADMLWEAFMRNDIKDRVVADLGCGTGRLLIGAVLLGASLVVGIDIDPRIIEILIDYIRSHDDIGLPAGLYDIIIGDIRFSPIRKIDTVIMNPPFGLRSRISDIVFLEKAFEMTEGTVYSLHLASKKNRVFIKRFAADKGYKGEVIKTYNYPIRQLHEAHRRRIYYIKVDYWRFRRRGK